MMFQASETHSLKVGDHFRWQPDETADCVVDAVGLWDYYGYPLFLYKASDGLHGHVLDHTAVWVDSE